MDLKNHQNSTLSNLCCLLPIQKVLNSNNNLTINLTSNLTGSFSNLRFFFEHVSVCKQRTWKSVRNLLNFFPQPTHMTLWHLAKSHNFETLFAIFKIFKNFRNGFPLCRVFFFRVFFLWQFSNRLFAECPKNCTQ